MRAECLMDRVFCSSLASPVGIVCLASTAAGLVKVGLPGESEDDIASWLSRAFPGAKVVAGERENAEYRTELGEYFSGARRTFDLKIFPIATEFGRRVLEATGRIPYGETVSYGEIAVAIGVPSAGRAVGRALAANPLPIVIPCHRVVGRDGSLVGFGGGLALKSWLLAHERGLAHAKEQSSDVR